MLHANKAQIPRSTRENPRFNLLDPESATRLKERVDVEEGQTKNNLRQEEAKEKKEV